MRAERARFRNQGVLHQSCRDENDERKKKKKKKKKRSRLFNKRNAALQRKVSLIIFTDFICWIPFVCVSFLHYLRVFDASPWYAVFSIIILPINSVINPLLYDNFIQQLFEKLRFYIYPRGRSKTGVASEGMVTQCVSNMDTEM